MSSKAVREEMSEVAVAVPTARGAIRRLASLHGPALLVQAVTVVYATWPMAWFASSRAAQNLGDPLLCAWMVGWGPRGLVSQGIHLFNAPIFSPERFAFAMSENLLGLSLPISPLIWLTGNPLLALNVMLLVCLAVGGFGVYLLARDLTHDWRAATVAGAVFAVAPYRLGQIGHPHVVGIYLTPIVLLLLLRLADRSARPSTVRLRLLGLGVVVALQFWTSLTGGLVTLIAVGAWALWVLASTRRDAGVVLLRAAVGLGVGFLLILPLAAAYFMVRRLHPGYTHAPDEALLYAGTLGAYLVADQAGPLIEPLYRLLRSVSPPGGGFWEKRLFPGVLPVSAACVAAGSVFAARRRGTGGEGSEPRRTSPVAFAATLVAVGVAFSLGPRWGNREDGVPLPFLALDAPFGGLMRVPARIGLVAMIGLALVVAIVLARANGRPRRVAFTIAVVVLAVEAMPSRFDMVEPPLRDEAMYAVAGRPGVVLALPTAEVDPNGVLYEESLVREAKHMWLATAHYRPMINGYMAYFPPSYDEVVRGVQDFPTRAAFSLLSRRDVRTLVVRKDMVGPTRWSGIVPQLDKWPGVVKVAESRHTVVFDITHAARD